MNENWKFWCPAADQNLTHIYNDSGLLRGSTDILLYNHPSADFQFHNAFVKIAQRIKLIAGNVLVEDTNAIIHTLMHEK